MNLPSGTLGLFLLEGMLTRCLAVSGQRSIELLGPGDVLSAAEWADGFGTVPKESRWRALDAGVIAVLDRGWHDRLGRWPEIHAALLDRAVERSRSTALCLALARVRNLSARLRLLLWHLADRWGRVEPEGIALPLSLSHETLAELACARRESVCRALQELARYDLVTSRADGGWMLRGSSPAEMDALAAGS